MSFDYVNKETRAGDVAQAVYCLPSKHDALSSNLSTLHQKKENSPRNS
jgi:hypothetical protein